MAWFSLALGIAELAAPRQAARVAGSPLPAGLVRAMGAREIANGVGLLTQPRSARWMWARVAGDAIDLALLALALLNRLPLRAHDSPEHEIQALTSRMSKVGKSASLLMRRAVSRVEQA